MKVLFAITTLVQVLVSCAMTVPETETTEAAQQQQQQVRGGGGGGTSKKAHSTTTHNRDLQKTVLGIELYTPKAGTGYSDLYTTTAVTTASVSSATGTLVVDSDKDLGYVFEYAQPPTVEQAAVSSDRYSDGNDVRATTKTVTVDTGGGRQGTGSRAATRSPTGNYYSSRYYTSGKGGKKGSKGKGTYCQGKGGGSQTRRPTPPPTPTIIEQIDQELKMEPDNVAGTCDIFIHVYNLFDKATVTLGQSGSPYRLLIKNAYYNGQQPPKALMDISGSIIGCDVEDTEFAKPLAALTNVGIEKCSWMFCDFKNDPTTPNPSAAFPCAGQNYPNICSNSTGINNVESGVVWDMYFSKNNTITIKDNASIGTLLCHGDQFFSLGCANITK